MIRADRYLPSTPISTWLNYGSSAVSRSASEFMTFLDASNTLSYPGTGTVWTDLSGNSRNGTLVSSPTFTNTVGGEINFTGGQYVSLTAGQFAFGTGQFSIEAWVYPRGTQVTNNIIFASQSSNSSGFYGLGYNTTNGWFLGLFDGSTRPTAYNLPVPSNDNWYHVVGTRDNTNTLRVWVNTRQPTTTAVSTLSLAAADTRIGMNPATSGERWEGRVSMFRVYNRALTYEEIIERYSWNRQRFGL